MIELLGVPLNIVNLSGWGAFVFLVWVIFHGFVKGKIRTEREVLELRADRDARLKEANEWKTAARIAQEGLRESQGQVTRMLELSETSAHILTSLPRGEGGQDV